MINECNVWSTLHSGEVTAFVGDKVGAAQILRIQSICLKKSSLFQFIHIIKYKFVIKNSLFVCRNRKYKISNIDFSIKYVRI